MWMYKLTTEMSTEHQNIQLEEITPSESPLISDQQRKECPESFCQWEIGLMFSYKELACQWASQLQHWKLEDNIEVHKTS